MSVKQGRTNVDAAGSWLCKEFAMTLLKTTILSHWINEDLP